MSATATLAQSAAIAFVGCAVSLWLLLRSKLARHMLDVPNPRSLHGGATPRIGGLAIAVGVAAAAAASWPQVPAGQRGALFAALALAIVSSVDDARGLPAAPRLIAHFAAAALWAWSAGIPIAWMPVAVVGICWSTNLYNFMDGSDGMAGGMAAIGFGAYAAAFAAAGATGPAALCVAVACAALGFLVFNAPPARVFMGDSGSIPLGFLAAAFGIEGFRTQAWHPIFPLLVFLPFWFDATLTLALRLLRGERPWQAHREHFYQKALRSGLGHRGVALRWYALMLGCAAAALVGRMQPVVAQAVMLFASIVLAGLLAAALERRYRRTSPP